jgi:hypothetical protein
MDTRSNYKPSRVILAVETRLLREMLKHAIAKSPHLKLVGEAILRETDLVSLVVQRDAEWVIMSLPPDGELPPTTSILWAAEPSVSILAVAPDGSQVKLGWKQPYQKPISEVQNGKHVKLGWTESREILLQGLSLDGLISVLRHGPLWEPMTQDHHHGWSHH